MNTFLKKYFSLFLIGLQILLLFNPSIVKANTEIMPRGIVWNGQPTFDTATGTIRIYTDSQQGNSPNTYYEYEFIGYSIAYQKENGEKYITQIKDNGSESNGFFVTYRNQYTGSNGQLREQTIRELKLSNLRKIFEQDFPNNDFSDITNPKQNGILTFNAILSTKPIGMVNYRASMDSNRNISGSYYYYTLSGTMNVEGGISTYKKSSKFLGPSYYDGLGATDWYGRYNAGILGSIVREENGKPWGTVPYQDLSNNYFGKKVVILGQYKPDPIEPRDVKVKLIDQNTNSIINEKIVYTASVSGTKTQTYSYTAPSLAGYNFSKSSIIRGREGETNINSDKTKSIVISTNQPTHEILFYYSRDNVTNNNPIGTITFNPNESGWKNSNIYIKVSVSGSTYVDYYGYDNRQYTLNGQTYSIRHPFVQRWSVDDIEVTSSGGSNLNGSNTVIIGNNSSTTTVKNNGTISISTETKDVKLSGSVKTWTSTSKTWSSNTTAPFGGTWLNNAISSSTNSPTAKYNGSSLYFSLDKTKPTSYITKTSNDWTNQEISNTVYVEDNLSGLNNQNLYLRDVSHYNRSDVPLNLVGETIVGSSPNKKYNYNSKFNIKTDGIYVVEGTVQDRAANSYSVSYGQFKFDNTVPNASSFSDDNRQYIDDQLKVSVGVSDNLSGISKVEYAITNSKTYNNEKKTQVNVTTNENNPSAVGNFDVTINKNGTWYVHTWSYDRAGNVKHSVSDEYKYFEISTDDIVISPTLNNGNIMRGTRFDISTTIKQFTSEDATNSKLEYTMPNWINDDINKKNNNKYVITSGFGAKVNAATISKTNPQFWSAFAVPFGTPLTKNNDGNVIGEQQKAEVQLTYSNYRFGAKKTKPIEIKFNIIPEQQVKTQITYNN